MTLICAALGTALSVLFIIMLKIGSKYSALVEQLDSGKYPLCKLYVAGLAWSQSGPIKLKGQAGENMKTYAGLLYGQKYAEYYANIAWAQAITYCHLFLSLTFLLAAVLSGMQTIILIAGILISIALTASSASDMKNTIDKRTVACEAALPEVVSTMAILVSSGMVLRNAWQLVGEKGEGEFYELMRRSSDRMRNGYSDTDAIYLFGQDSHSTEIKKFSSALIQNLERGGTDLSLFLMEQSSELWNAKRQKILQEGEKASGKLLAPIVIIFLGIMIIVMTAAFAGLFA